MRRQICCAVKGAHFPFISRIGNRSIKRWIVRAKVDKYFIVLTVFLYKSEMNIHEKCMKVLLYNLIFTLNDKTFCYCKLVKI